MSKNNFLRRYFGSPNFINFIKSFILRDSQCINISPSQAFELYLLQISTIVLFLCVYFPVWIGDYLPRRPWL